LDETIALGSYGKIAPNTMLKNQTISLLAGMITVKNLSKPANATMLGICS
jgi:hypothetical protein